jgi:formylglycine-generating enzyme required for sulfatase activity
MLGVVFLHVVLAAQVDFRASVAPILEQKCLHCHGAGAHVDLSSRQRLLDQKNVAPGNPAKSPLYTSLEKGSMPPGGKLSAEEMASIRDWIEQGAAWPADVTLTAPKSTPPAQSAEAQNVQQIRERILAHPQEKAEPYKVTIPNTTVSYSMAPVAAGDFLMGSSAKPDEQPQHKVHVDAFSMQVHEVTWDEYRLFMFANQAGETGHKDGLVDAISRPTRPYVEMSFGMGIDGYPAISMTQHAANKYAEWLSAKTGEFYRLPTEAEWEYACRAGSTGNPSPLDDYAWYSKNSAGKYAKVAAKKPNAWGLYDMLGNVMEWTLDAYSPYKAGAETNPWVQATQPYPQVARGGSWNDPADAVGCAVRVASDPSWKQQDPQLPKSIWYLTDAQWLGFRLVRPAKIPTAEEMYKYWNNGVEHDEH